MTDTPILPTIDPAAYWRTIVPVLYGSALAKLAAVVPLIASALAFIDANFGTGWRDISAMLATAAVIGGYYWLARKIGRRWPAAEKWLLGRSAIPVYVDNNH